MPFDFRFQERRAASRYRANRPPAFLGWYDGDAYRSTPVKVIDLSMVGILVEVEVFPPRKGDVWLSLVGQKPSQWIEVNVIKRNWQWRGFRIIRQLRLKFHQACTYDFFKAAIEGFSREPFDPNTESSRQMDHVWR